MSSLRVVELVRKLYTMSQAHLKDKLEMARKEARRRKTQTRNRDWETEEERKWAGEEQRENEKQGTFEVIALVNLSPQRGERQREAEKTGQMGVSLTERNAELRKQLEQLHEKELRLIQAATEERRTRLAKTVETRLTLEAGRQEKVGLERRSAALDRQLETLHKDKKAYDQLRERYQLLYQETKELRAKLGSLLHPLLQPQPQLQPQLQPHIEASPKSEQVLGLASENVRSLA